MRALVAILLLAGAAALAALGMQGCGGKHLTAPALSTPHTTIFIDGPIDTVGVNHIVHLHWFGSDPHGYIAGYEVRLLDSLVAPADTAWRFTTLTDSVLTVQTPDGYTRARFQVRSINDRGVKDPNPATQRFYFRNQPPIVQLIGKPNRADKSDTTFASVSVTWTVTDLDGDASKVVVRAWLDGRANSPVATVGTSLTMPSSEFLQNGVFQSGPRTLYIQGVDDGGMAGPIDQVTWYVKKPVDLPDAQGRGRLLLIDDLPNTDGAKQRVDTLYANAIANTGLAPGTWTTLHLQFDQPFRSSEDLRQTMNQFRAVVWYRGEQTSISTVLLNYADGLGAYLDGGGRVFLESLNMISAWSSTGPLTVDFIDQHLNCDGVFLYGQPPDSSAAWGMAASGVLQFPAIADSVQNKRIIGGLRAFIPRDWSQVLLYAPAHTMSRDTPYDFALGMVVPQKNNGLFIADTYPMVSGTISTAGFPQRASLALYKIMVLLGLSGP